MAKSDDLDLTRLFGLSPEEAQGLGLDAFGHPPADEPAADADAVLQGLPSMAGPATPAPSAPARANDAAALDEILDDEMALLALLAAGDDAVPGGRARDDYKGYGATHGLSLAQSLAAQSTAADAGTPQSAPADLGTWQAMPPGPAMPVPPTAVRQEDHDAADHDAAGRFVVQEHDAAGDDGDVDVAALFGLSDEEALGLGLAATATADEPRVRTLAPSGESFPSVPFPTMRLRAMDDGDSSDGDETASYSLTRAADVVAPTSDDATQAAAPFGEVAHVVPQHDQEPVPEPAPAPYTDEAQAWQDVDTVTQDDLPAGALQADTTPPLPFPLSAHERADDGAPALTGGAARSSAIEPALLDAFAEESAELLDGLHVELEQVERDRGDRAALLEIRRIVHTIKGGAKMCGFDAVVTLTHSAENLLDLVAEGQVTLDDAALRALFECEPLLYTTVQEALSGGEGDLAAVLALAQRFDGFCHGAAGKHDTVASFAHEDLAVADGDGADVEPVALHLVDPLDDERDESPAQDEAASAPLETSEPAPATLFALPRRLEGDAGSAPAPAPEQAAGSETRSGSRRQARSLNVDLTKVDAVVAKITEMAAHRASSHGMIGRLLETTGEARRNVTRLQNLAMQIGNECAGIRPEDVAPEDELTLESYNALNTLVLQLQEAVSDQLALVQGLHDTITSHWSLQATESRVDADIQSALMNIRLIPLASMRVRLDGVVRQAAETTGKNVRWQLQGGNVAVEKNVFDRLFEPLMHLLRNAVDHGIETPSARRAAGKPETGSITVAAAQEGNQIVITIADDGAGIVPNKIASLAVDRGIVGADEASAMTYQQKLELIFTPGFSTAKEVSHISGRGVGMDAVREACLRMGGAIEVSSRQGSGTTFTMRLPLSLSVTRGLIVRDGGCLMAVPVSQVTALHLVPSADVVATPHGRVARLEGQELPVYNLPSFPGAGPASYVQNGEVNVLQVSHEGGSIGLVIEDVLGEEEIVIKAPPALLRGVKTLLGAHVMPDGRVAPVVNLPQMLVDLRPATTLVAPRREDAPGEMTALVVDDSMSMRVALTGTLQSAGFKVLTARDGQEALDVLKREGLPRLITLDVEMPRMDGLETLFAIRQMAGAQELPVFMMTSRGGAKHRRAAEQLGATRYFTKPYRDSELATAARDACAS